MRTLFVSILFACLLGTVVSGGVQGADDGPAGPTTPVDDTLSAYTESVPGTLVEFDIVPVPGGSVTIDGTERTVDPLWIAVTEVRWDAYDTYRLPTAAQWKRAYHLGYGTPSEWGADQLGEHAWFAGNAKETAHPISERATSDLGTYDQLGNAAELVVPPEGDPDRETEVWGGSYQSAAAEVHCSARQEKTDAWQESDPQLPKSQWWLSDAQFVGFRLVRTAE